jgi:tRNA nucleotidyltransferase (CCA-adding enzyme)
MRIDKRGFGDILDVFGGLEDIHNKIIRTLHKNSYRDDPTRIFRAVRYEQRYNFKIDILDLQLIEESRLILEKISGERIRNELTHIFAEPQPEKILSRLEKFGILKSISENLYLDEWLSDQWDTVKRFPSIYDWKLEMTERQKIDLFYILWFSHLFHKSQDSTEIIMNRIKLSNTLKDSIRSVEMLRNVLTTMISDPPSKITSCLEKFRMPSLYIAYLTFDNEKVKDIIYNYVSRWIHISPNITGEDLKKRGIKPGVVYNHILGQLRNAWLDGNIKTEKEELLLLDDIVTAFTGVNAVTL